MERMLFPSPAGINSGDPERLGNRLHLRRNLGLIVRNRGLLSLHLFHEREELLLLLVFFRRLRTEH